MRIDRTVAQDADITLEAARDALASPKAGMTSRRRGQLAAAVGGCEGKNNGSFASKYSLLASEPLFLHWPSLAGRSQPGQADNAFLLAYGAGGDPMVEIFDSLLHDR